MQIKSAFGALTNLVPSSKFLLVLAIQIGFVLRKPRKSNPGDLFRSVLLAVAEGMPHNRGVAEKLSALSTELPSRQAVFKRLRQDSAVDFFYGAFQQVLREQTRRFVDPRLKATLKKSETVFGRIIIEDGSVIPLHGTLSGVFKAASSKVHRISSEKPPPSAFAGLSIFDPETPSTPNFITGERTTCRPLSICLSMSGPAIFCSGTWGIFVWSRSTKLMLQERASSLASPKGRAFRTWKATLSSALDGGDLFQGNEERAESRNLESSPNQREHDPVLGLCPDDHGSIESEPLANDGTDAQLCCRNRSRSGGSC